MSASCARNESESRAFVIAMRFDQANISAAWMSIFSRLMGSFETAFCSNRRETPSASMASKAGLTPRTSFQNDPLASKLVRETVIFWKASSRPSSSESTVTRKGENA